MPLDVNLTKLRGVVLDLRIGTLNDPEKIEMEIQAWEAVRNWAIAYRKLMDVVEELGDRIDLGSYFAPDSDGTEILGKWREDAAGLRVEKEKLMAKLAEMDKLVAVLRKGKR